MAENQLHTQPTPNDPLSDAAFVRVLTIAVLTTFSFVMLIFSFALFEDLQLLQVPGMVWAFICGAPNPDGPAMPLMLTFTTLGFIGSIGVTVYHVYRQFRDRQSA